MKIFNVYINKKSKVFQTISVILILSILSYFVVYSKTNYKIVTNIVDIFIYVLLPSLFPFILFSNILIYSGYFNILANTRFSRFLERIFKVSCYGASSVIFGFLFGYPNGARYVNQLYEDKKISHKEAEYLLLFVNNSSPAFVISSIGIGMFGNIKIGILLLISHVIAAILVGIIYRFKYNICKGEYSNKKEKESIEYNLSFDVITKAITKTVYTMCIIFGFIVIFIYINNYLLKIITFAFGYNKYIDAFMLCVMELTSGINKLTALDIDLKLLITLISFFLGFSSLSINFQIYSCVHKNNFKLKNILKGKILHGILSAIITYILVNVSHIYEYINITSNVNSTIHRYNYIDVFNNHIIISCIVFLIHILLFLLITKKKRHHIVSLKGG